MTQYFPESDKSWKGHDRKTKSGLQSTKQALQQELVGALTTPHVKAREKVVYHKIYNMHNNLEKNVFTDQTGKFPVKSFFEM